jgi:hypothetical protein
MELLFDLATWELLSYVVTVVGLPFAIGVFWLEQRKERANEQEEIFSDLADEYTEFSKILIRNSDLRLLSGRGQSDEQLTDEQREKKLVIFDMLTSLLERAYILIYEDHMDKQTTRMWQTWEDYINFWCQRPDFRQALPELLLGEDPDFGEYMRRKIRQYDK